MDTERPVTDADRQAAVAALRTHAGAGAIDLDEFGRRTEQVLAATTVADLDAAFTDLPGGAPVLVPTLPVAPVVRRRHRTPYPLVARLAPVAPWAILFIAIWAFTGFGYFWPVWPILGISIGALKHGRHRWRSPHWV
jgi:hypothetical protein